MRINSFSGLRFFLTLFVFFTHCELFATIEKCQNLYSHVYYGGYSVTVFLMLSGFCVYLGYNTRFDSLSLNDIKAFIKKRFLKLYPAFIISNFVVFLVHLIFDFAMSPHTLESILRHIYHNLGSYLAIIFMVQAWIPSLATVGNSASWFISTLFFSYLISPIVIYYYNKIRTKCNFAIIFTVAFLFTFYTIPMIRSSIANLIEMSPINDELFKYTFPLFRFPNFFFGIVLCDLYLKTENWLKENIKKCIFSLLEIALLASFFFIKDFQKVSVCRYVMFTLMIFVFAMDKGIVSKFFATKASHWFSDRSLYFYLFHFPILSLPLFVFYKIRIYFLTLPENEAIVFASAYYTAGFLLSLLAAYLYDKAETKITKRIKAKK